MTAACGGGAGATTPVASQPPDAEPATDAVTADPTTSEPAAESDAEVRLVNLWAGPDGQGPDVVLHVFGETDGDPLLEASPGEATEYVDVPAAIFGSGPARLEVARADDAGEGSRDLSPNEGDSLTVFAYGRGSDDGETLAVFGLDSDAWPDMQADKVSLMVYPGALQTLPSDINGVALSTTGGECLLDESGEPQRLGFGGNVPVYYQLEPGATELAVAHFPGPECMVEPEVGTVTIEGEAGDRLALVPWGTGEGAIELFVLEVGSQP